LGEITSGPGVGRFVAIVAGGGRDGVGRVEVEIAGGANVDDGTEVALVQAVNHTDRSKLNKI
jgi:hypothetical protein